MLSGVVLPGRGQKLVVSRVKILLFLCLKCRCTCVYHIQVYSTSVMLTFHRVVIR